VKLPESLRRFRQTAAGRTWLDGLPAAIDRCAHNWDLSIGEPFPNSYVSLVLRVTSAAGTPAILKLQCPDRESEHEAAALRVWNGNAAIRLLGHDPENRALLLEQCDPGYHLSSTGPEKGIEVLIGLLPRLWVEAGGPFGSLSDEVAGWLGILPQEFETAGEPFDRHLLHDVMAIIADLSTTQGEQVLLHQDLHGDNVLRAQREPWLAIDPKPLVGEREFGLSPIIRSTELGHSREHMMYRLDRLTGELGLDRNRARLWAAGQAVAWGFEDGKVLTDHIETARWLLQG
jgi:streptomycin 6-kinase